MRKYLMDTVLDLIFPSNIYCISCGKPINDNLPYALCDSCVRIINWANQETCEVCGKPLRIGKRGRLCSDCQKWPRFFNRGITCTQYGTLERDLIHRFKYHDQSYYGRKLADLMIERLKVEDLQVDIVLPVPMYKGKEKRRGYNQASLLAKNIAIYLEKPFNPGLLIRATDTLPMSALGITDRRDNIEGVFVVKKEKQREICGKAVLLVDDVFTTGSTADGCAKVLLKAGAVKVYVATFAAGIDPIESAL